MTRTKTFKFLIEGGKATPGPPIGPSLGPLGLNLIEVVNKINQMTKEFAGMRVPVYVTVDIDSKTYEIEIGRPSTAALILKEIGVEKGSGEAGRKVVGDLKIEQVIKIAKIKWPDMMAKTLKAAVKEVLGTCVSMGVTVEGKNPKIIQQEVNEGKYDNLIREYEEGE